MTKLLALLAAIVTVILTLTGCTESSGETLHHNPPDCVAHRIHERTIHGSISHFVATRCIMPDGAICWDYARGLSCHWPGDSHD